MDIIAIDLYVTRLPFYSLVRGENRHFFTGVLTISE